MTLSDFIEELNIAIQQDGHDIYCNACTAKIVKRCLMKKKEGNMSEKEYALQILDEIRNRDGIGYNDYSDLWDAISEIPEVGEEGWIPVSESEELPEDEYVLISKKPTKLSGSKWSVAIAIRTADPRSGKIQWRDTGFGVIQDDKVLAWRPLPAPYQEGEKDG